VKPHLPAGFIKADDAVDFVRRQRVTEFAVAHATLGAAKTPEGLLVHCYATFLFHLTIRWESWSESHKGLAEFDCSASVGRIKRTGETVNKVFVAAAFSR
jgi:hypothetical protein